LTPKKEERHSRAPFLEPPRGDRPENSRLSFLDLPLSPSPFEIGGSGGISDPNHDPPAPAGERINISKQKGFSSLFTGEGESGGDVLNEI
jgi:hypothetical protein